MQITAMLNVIYTIIGWLISGILGGIIALWLESLRRPNLAILSENEANSDNVYPEDHPKQGQRWKFFRLSVTNVKLFFPLNFISSRETAQNCSVQIVFSTTRGKHLFTMAGRWASTPEIPFTGNEMLLKTLYPDPITIPSNNNPEYLDIVVQHDRDGVAYAWNAESYAFDWRNPNRRLTPGNYKINVAISTQNGVTFTKTFMLIVSKNINQTEIVNN